MAMSLAMALAMTLAMGVALEWPWHLPWEWNGHVIDHGTCLGKGMAMVWEATVV